MALYRIAIHKVHGGEEWSNTYVVNAGSLAAATAEGNSIVAIEKAVHLTQVQFVRMYVAPLAGPAGSGTMVGLTGTGAVGGRTDLLPLFNTVRVIFRTASGKPSQKYLRLPLGENDHTSGIVDPTHQTFVNTNYTAPMLALASFVDVDGQAFTSASLWPYVQIRQLKRKRRSRAGFVRGWVPG